MCHSKNLSNMECLAFLFPLKALQLILFQTSANLILLLYLLFAKLPMLGLHHALIRWIASFLSDRSIAFRIDCFLSESHSINSDVPQVSGISPVLFILLLNDLLSSTSSSIYSFADDTCLSSSSSTIPQHLSYSSVSPYRYTSASLVKCREMRQ